MKISTLSLARFGLRFGLALGAVAVAGAQLANAQSPAPQR